MFGGCFAATSLFAIPAENPYSTIIDRNAFGLKPPPVVTAVDTKPPEPPPNVKFTGVSVMGDEKRAWFVILPKVPTELPQYLSLKVGTGAGGVELKEIFDDRGEARIITGGRETTLTMEKAGGPAAGAPGARPNMPVAVNAQMGTVPGIPAPAAGLPLPNASSSSVIAGGPNSVIAGASPLVIAGATRPGVPTPGIQPMAGSASVPTSVTPATTATATTVIPQNSSGLRSIPSRTLRLSPANTSSGQTANETFQPKSKEEATATHALMIEATREAVAQKKMPPLPPLPQ